MKGGANATVFAEVLFNNSCGWVDKLCFWANNGPISEVAAHHEAIVSDPDDFGYGHFLDDVARLCRYLLKWAIWAIPLGWALGSACAGFLWSLDAVTHLRVTHPWLLW